VSFEIVRSRYATLDALDIAGLNAFLAAMSEEATAITRLGQPEGPLTERRTAFMRYHGQGHEIEIPLPPATWPTGTSPPCAPPSRPSTAASSAAPSPT
jgi:hypothetical protein